MTGKLRQVFVDGDTALVFVGGKSGATVLLDAADVPLVDRKNWSRTRGGYALASFDNKLTYMHRRLMGEPPSPELQVDHVNGDRLDNRRANLRWVTASQNGANRHKSWGSSRFVGVSRYKARNQWTANIRRNGKVTFLGYFEREEDAAEAYRAARAALG